MKTWDQVSRPDNFMFRFKASVRWMSQDLSRKTRIFHRGGLTEKRPRQSRGVKLRQMKSLVFFTVLLLKFLWEIPQLRPVKNVNNHFMVMHFSFYWDPWKKKKKANKKLQNKNVNNKLNRRRRICVKEITYRHGVCKGTWVTCYTLYAESR